MPPRTTSPSKPTTPVPWWRLPIMWLIVGGPAAVVVAGFVTLGIAIRNPDPVLKPAPTASKSELPAVQARNHAATPSN